MSSIPNIEKFVKRMAEEFGETFSKPTTHPYGEKTMSFHGEIFSYPSAYKQLSELHMPIFLANTRTGKVSTNNGKVRTDDDRHHNSLKGVWQRFVRPSPPVDKDLKRDKNADRQLKRVRDRSEYADAGAADRIAVERANKKSNLDSAAFGRCLIIETDKTGQILTEPAFDTVLRARRSQEAENARRRNATVVDVQARLERAVQLGLIDQSSAFSATGIAPVIQNILHKKIGPDHQTLHDLFLTHAIYFGLVTIQTFALTRQDAMMMSGSRLSNNRRSD